MDYDSLYRERDAAARTIQAAWRGRKGRRAFDRLRDAAQKIQAVAKGWYVRKKIREQRDRGDLDRRFQDIMEKHREKIQVLEVEKRELMKVPGGELEDWEMRRLRAVIKVQAHWRGLVQRRRMAQSPERVQREKAARQIQSAFKKMLVARRSVQSIIGASVATTASMYGSPPHVRQSNASVLIGSPRLMISPGNAGAAPSPGGTTMPSGADVAELGRGASYMGPKRYKELETQVNGRTSAAVALAKVRSTARRPDPRPSDERLGELLRQYKGTAQERMSATHTRQRNLVVMDTLSAQLDQVRPLKDLPDNVKPQDFPRPARGSERMERASQAHALMLAEARVGSKWWKHLKGLNTQAVQDALLAEDSERWQELDQRWRRMWTQLDVQEDKRPDVLQELAAPVGIGKAAVEEAKMQAAMSAKEAEYKAAMAASPVMRTQAMYTSPIK